MSGHPPEITRELVDRARAGDEAAIERLARAAYPLVRRWSLVRMGDATDAEDLTQDVIVQMVRRLTAFEGSSRFQTWLYAVTRNVATDRLRARGRRRALELDPRAWAATAPDAAADPSGAAERVQLRRVLQTFFLDLPARQREILDLVDLQGLSAVEVAGLTGLAASTVRVHLLRARRTLRARILAAHPALAERAQ